MTINFEIDLGHGWFMDSTGRLHRDPNALAPRYQLSSGLHITAKDVEKVAEILKTIQKAMPDKEDPKSVENFKKLGFSNATISFLASVGAIAGTASTVVGIVAAVLVVGAMLVNFTDEESGANKQLEAVKGELEAFSKAIADMLRNTFVVELQAEIAEVIAGVETFVLKFADYKPKADELLKDLDKLRSLERDFVKVVSKALDTLKWGRPYDHSDYPWMWLGNLYWEPEGASAPVPVDIAQGRLRFDHRLAVPFALYSVAAYLMLIKTIAPEYRTTGEYSFTLKALAIQTSTLAANIREQGIARTIFRPEDFVPSSLRSFFGPLFDPPEYVIWHRYSVGAVDLAAYTNAFLRRTPVTVEERENARLGKAAIKRGEIEMLWWPGMNPVEGSLETAWNPPSPLKLLLSRDYPEKSAAEANEVSEGAYTALLITSGYLQLVHQAVVLRDLYTEPNISETVAHTKTSYARNSEGQKSITVTSGPILGLASPITSSARQDTQGFRVRTLLTTQPIGRDNAWKVGYRVVLRSLSLASDGLQVVDPDYADLYRARQVDDVELPTFKRLVVDVDRTRFKGEIVLADRLSDDARGSPTHLLSDGGSGTLKVDTFDWYIPVRWLDFTLRPDGIEKVPLELAATGWTEGAARPVPRTDYTRKIDLGEDIGPGMVGDLAVAWRTAPPDIEGERRNLREESYTVDWSIRWEAERLIVTIEGSPEQRNCLLFLVVEERLKRSGQFLHTVFPVPLNTQMTSVPIEFFEKEKAASERANEALSGAARKHALQGGIEAVRERLDGYLPNEFVLKFGIQELYARYQGVLQQDDQIAPANSPLTEDPGALPS